MKGFFPTWCSWMQYFFEGDNVAIKINDQLGPYFETRKGLRQVDPISPILFNILVDMLALIIARTGGRESRQDSTSPYDWSRVC